MTLELNRERVCGLEVVRAEGVAFHAAILRDGVILADTVRSYRWTRELWVRWKLRRLS